MFFLYLIFFLVALFQATFLSLNLLLVATVALSVIKVNKQTVLLIFVSGLLYDLLILNLLGVHSLFLLVPALLIFLYQRKFQTNNWYYLIIISLLFLVLNTFLVVKAFSWFGLFSEIIFSFLFFFFFKIILYKYD